MKVSIYGEQQREENKNAELQGEESSAEEQIMKKAVL
jgi:hypothetical protein